MVQSGFGGKSIIVLASIILQLFLQFVAGQPVTAQPRTTPAFYNIVRYNDRDFSFLRTDTSDRDIFNPIKYIPLSSPAGNSFITLGGELREEYRYYQNENWGDIATERVDTDGFLWHRFMLHADVRLGKHFRVFGQVKNCLVFSRAGGARPVVDEDTIDVNQAFVEIGGAIDQTQALMLRLGRQEFNYGAARILSMRDGVNVRQGFDAFLLKYRSPRLTADVFIGQGADTKRGMFDDVRLQSEAIWGLYSTYMLELPLETPSKSPSQSGVSQGSLRTTTLDAYYFGFRRDSWQYASVRGAEDRHSFGGRISSRVRTGISFEAEAVYQTGAFAAMPISAYLFAGSVNYAFDIPLQPALGLGWSIASGDQNPTDRVANTFNPMYPKPLCTFGQALASSNLTVLQPFLNLSIVPELQLQLTAYLLSLTSSNDGLYAASTVQSRIAPALKNAHEAREVGNQYTGIFTWNINRHLRLVLEGTYFTAGSYIRLTGTGQNMLYGAAQFQFTF